MGASLWLGVAVKLMYHSLPGSLCLSRSLAFRLCYGLAVPCAACGREEGKERASERVGPKFPRRGPLFSLLHDRAVWRRLMAKAEHWNRTAEPATAAVYVSVRQMRRRWIGGDC